MFCRFLDLGGKEKEGVQILSESYVGLPHVLNVLIEWLHAAGMYCGPACDECMSKSLSEVVVLLYIHVNWPCNYDFHE